MPEKTAVAHFGKGIRGYLEYSIDGGKSWTIQDFSPLTSQESPIEGPGVMTLDLRTFPAKRSLTRFVFEETE